MVYLKFFLITVVYFCCVKSSDVNVNSNIKSESTKRNSRRYNYNHPPSAEIYKPTAIPVDVVYEEEKRKDKSIKIDELKSEFTETTYNYDNESNTELSTTELNNQHKLKPTDIYNNKSSDELLNNGGSVTLNGSFKVNIKAEGDMKKDIKQTSHSESEIKIPVAVIYDEQPDLLSHEKVSSSEKNQPNPRHQRKRTKNLQAAHENMQNKYNGESQLRLIVANKTNASTKFSKRVRERAPVVPIVQSENYVYSHTGNFHYSYEGGDGTKAYERGEMRSLDKNVGASVVGSFSYVGKDGNDYGLTYTADENGYRPVGAHLPTPPPIPPAIARALKYLATKTTPEPVTEATKTHLL